MSSSMVLSIEILGWKNKRVSGGLCPGNWLEIVFDQIGTPTSAADLAKVCLEILAISKSDNISKRGKIYHFSNEGVTSWYDFAKQILEISGILCKIKPIESSQYAALVNRPPFSVLNKAKIKADFGFEIPHWSDSLKTWINIW